MNTRISNFWDPSPAWDPGTCADEPPSPSQPRGSLGTPSQVGTASGRPADRQCDPEPCPGGDRPSWRRSAAVHGPVTRAVALEPQAERPCRRAGQASPRSAGSAGRPCGRPTRASWIDRARQRRRSCDRCDRSSGAAGSASHRSRTGPAPLVAYWLGPSPARPCCDAVRGSDSDKYSDKCETRARKCLRTRVRSGARGEI